MSRNNRRSFTPCYQAVIGGWLNTTKHRGQVAVMHRHALGDAVPSTVYVKDASLRWIRTVRRHTNRNSCSRRGGAEILGFMTSPRDAESDWPKPYSRDPGDAFRFVRMTDVCEWITHLQMRSTSFRRRFLVIFLASCPPGPVISRAFVRIGFFCCRECIRCTLTGWYWPHQSCSLT